MAQKSMTKLSRIPKESGGDTPRDALFRVELALDEGKLPQLHDLELMAGPAKLPKRKKLLLRLLSEQFGLYGKCIPVANNNNDSGTLRFITNCTIGELTSIALDRVKEAYKEGAK